MMKTSVSFNFLTATALFLAMILLAAPAAALDIDTSGEPSLGPADAPVRILLFYDFQCGHCAKTSPVLLQVVRQYGNLAHLVAVNVPAPGHPYALPAAELALIANDQGKFWDAFDKIFANQSDLSPEKLAALGHELGLDEKIVSQNLANIAHRALLKRDFYKAVDIGIKYTPTIYINEIQLVGFHKAEVFQYHINAELEKKGIKSPVGPVAKPQEEEKSVPENRVPSNMIYPVKVETPIDSKLRVKVGDKAPDFELPTLSGKKVRLADYIGKKNVVLSFVPAAWTPVCSGQWPEYNENKKMFENADAVLIGITTDNIPSLYSWCTTMGELWFEVASDFYPHGAAAQKFGILRSSGVTERSVFVIDKKGVIRYIDVHDINTRPDLKTLAVELKKLADKP